MSDGQLITIYPEFPEQVIPNKNVLLIDTATGADNGQWVPYTPFSHASVELSGTAASGISVQICGSNAPIMPANTSAGSPIGSALTAMGMTTIDTPTRWIKAKVAAGLTGGNISVTINTVARS